MSSWLSGMWDWLSSLLKSIGLEEKSGKLLFIGLDNAGKTTLMGRLKSDLIDVHVPTLHPTSESLSLGGVNFTAFDLGGHAQVRRVWKDYYEAADGVVFLVDATDLERLPEARAEIHSLLDDEAVAYMPIAIFGNKIDKGGALSEADLQRHLGIDKICTGKVSCSPDYRPARPLEVFMISVKNRQGYGEGIRWLAEYLD